MGPYMLQHCRGIIEALESRRGPYAGASNPLKPASSALISFATALSIPIAEDAVHRWLHLPALDIEIDAGARGRRQTCGSRDVRSFQDLFIV